MPGTYSAGFDRISRTANAPFAVAGAITLDSGIFGRSVVAGSSGANYTITLPTSGPANSVLEIIIPAANAFVVTLSAAGLIDGAATQAMLASESALLLWNGTTYTKIGGRTIPCVCHLQPTASVAQAIANSTVVVITLPVIIANIGAMADTANNRAVVRRAGNYDVQAYINIVSGFTVASVRTLLGIQKNGANEILDERNYLIGNDYQMTAGGVANCAASDNLRIFGFQSSGGSLNTDNTNYKLRLVVTELSPW